MRLLRPAAVLAAGVFLVAGCSGSDQDPRADPPVEHSPSMSTTTAIPTPSPSPTVSDSQDLAAEAAVAAMNDFLARDRDYDTWWTAFREHLSPSAAQAFEYTEPAMIPATKITDSGQISAYPDGTSATVLVGTDIGQYRVALVRETAEHPWFVDRIDPPEGS